MTSNTKPGEPPDERQSSHTVAGQYAHSSGKTSRKLLAMVAGIIVLAALIWWGMGWWQTGRFMEETDNAYVRTDSVAVRAELSARVVEVAVDDNQTVKQGDLLIRLDAESYRDQVTQAEAQQAVAAASIAQSHRQVDLQQAAIDQATAQQQAAQANLDQARQHLERSSSLAANNYGSRQQREDDQAALSVAQAKLAESQAAVVSARRQLAVAESDVTRAEANLDAASADLDYARHQLDKTRIVAPRDGVIGNLRVEVGTLAQPSLTLLQLVPIESAYVAANFKETQLERIRVGQPVAVHLDAYPDITYEGIVDSLSPATGTEFSLLPQDNATGNFNKIVQRVPVKIRVTGPTEALSQLRAGLSAVPEIDTRHLEPQNDSRPAQQLAAERPKS
ncbi:MULTISPECIES: HlyD family secretion protein [Halomonadaceae]|uniref:Multidrug export protein EmrA n=1 Tax=Vreelandella titanicae TaxID=664683 RepID=A0AAP9NJ01_9GAMM|nr:MULTISPECIES: HlyD family secretion protein [Halomonas]QKS22952.1 Multidrug export protein EmrA [Halomonas titanicae]CDG55862.1 Secretion protein HlyD [Halomonas sp. A3H3]SDI21025.1 membrane fusion protein, multidrug efflux system [Halomonas titanicae]